MAGYSGTPLIKKLGIVEGMRLSVLNAPIEFWSEIGKVPEVEAIGKPVSKMDFILYFVDNKKDLKREFKKLAKTIKKNGMIWISWPKKAAKVQTDLDEGIIREIGLATGLVDVKVCAVTEKWSGLKFVIRLKDRPKKK